MGKKKQLIRRRRICKNQEQEQEQEHEQEQEQEQESQEVHEEEQQENTIKRQRRIQHITTIKKQLDDYFLPC